MVCYGLVCTVVVLALLPRRPLRRPHLFERRFGMQPKWYCCGPWCSGSMYAFSFLSLEFLFRKHMFGLRVRSFVLALPQLPCKRIQESWLTGVKPRPIDSEEITKSQSRRKFTSRSGQMSSTLAYLPRKRRLCFNATTNNNRERQDRSWKTRRRSASPAAVSSA